MSDISHKEIKNDKLKRKYEFVIASNYMNKKIEEQLSEQQKIFSMAGFRKGKVPLHVVKMHKEKDITNTVISDEIRITSENFFKENSLVPIDRPNIVDISFEKDLKYSIEIELTPDTPSIEIEALDIKKESVEINDEDIAKHEDELSKSCFDLVQAEESHKIQEEDVLYVDFVGKINNKVFEGGAGKDFMIVVGSNTVLPEIEKALLGLCMNNDVTVDAEFPEDYPMKELALKKAQFSINIKKVMIKKQITDEGKIIKRFHCKTQDAFKTKAQQGLQKKCDFMINTLVKKEIFDYLDKHFIFDVPETMIQAEARKISAQFKNKDEIMPEAEKRVRLGFLLMKVAQEKSIAVTEEDTSRALIEKAQGDAKNMQYIIDVYKKNPQSSITLKGEILEEKVTHFIIESLPKLDAIAIKELEEKFNTIKG